MIGPTKTTRISRTNRNEKSWGVTLGETNARKDKDTI